MKGDIKKIITSINKLKQKNELSQYYPSKWNSISKGFFLVVINFYII